MTTSLIATRNLIGNPPGADGNHDNLPFVPSTKECSMLHFEPPNSCAPVLALYDHARMNVRQATTVLANDPVLLSLLERIRSALDPERAYLFGSRARGQAIPDSDYDFLVVVPHSEKPLYRRDQQAYLAMCGSGAAKDIIVLKRAEFESSRRASSSLTSAVLSEGILLHESGNTG